MRLYRRPWIWLFRFRHRKGYGIHSPFAFSLITDVIYEHSAYYAYRDLNRLHPWWVRVFELYPLTCRRLLFRLANFAHPQNLQLLGERPIEKAYIAAAVPQAQWCTSEADFVFVAHENLSEAKALIEKMPEDGMMVVEGIHEDATSLNIWRVLQTHGHTGVTFDLYTYGILFFNTRLTKQHYVVNV